VIRFNNIAEIEPVYTVKGVGFAGVFSDNMQLLYRNRYYIKFPMLKLY